MQGAQPAGPAVGYAWFTTVKFTVIAVKAEVPGHQPWGPVQQAHDDGFRQMFVCFMAYARPVLPMRFACKPFCG